MIFDNFYTFFLRKFVLVILFLLLHVPSFSATISFPIKNWQYITKAPFNIFYKGKNTHNAEQVLETLLKSYPRLSREIGIALIDTTSIFICPTEKDFFRFVGKNFPDWSAGIAAPSQNLIILKTPNLLPNYADNKLIAVHELSHILLHKAVNSNFIPRWFDEGLAVYYSGEKLFASSSLVSKALITESIIDLKDINQVLGFHDEKAQLAYQESYLAIRYLFEQFGKEKVKQIIFLMGTGKSLNQAFVETIGMDENDFEYEWFQYIKKKYRFHFLLDFDNYLWVIILLLFVIGFILIRRRNRRTIRRWEYEDDDWHSEWSYTQMPWEPDDND